MNRNTLSPPVALMALALLMVVLALPASAEEDWDWPRPEGERFDTEAITRCANPKEGRSGVDQHLTTYLRRAAGLSAEEALALLEKVRRRAYQEKLSRPLLDWHIALRLVDLKRYREAIERLIPLADNPYFLRTHTDSIRVSLARLHIALNEPEQALAWLAPVIDPSCHLPRESALLLAVDLHLDAGRYEEALKLLDRARLPPTDRNQSWILTQIDLIARLRGLEAATEATLEQLASAARGEALSAALAPIVEQLAQREALRPRLQAAVQAGILDEQLRIRPPPPLVPVEPIERKVSYPRNAEYLGMPGLVTVLVKIDPEGEVAGIKILEASPPGYFEYAVIQAVQQWRFRPQLVDGQPVTAYGQTTIKFRMRD